MVDDTDVIVQWVKDFVDDVKPVVDEEAMMKLKCSMGPIAAYSDTLNEARGFAWDIVEGRGVTWRRKQLERRRKLERRFQEARRG